MLEMLINHRVLKSKIQLAMIEGTQVRAVCGETFVPEVVVGTSGKAYQPGAPLCDRCEELLTISSRWSRLKDERDRIDREMAQLDAERRRIRRSTVAPAPAVVA